MWAESTCMGEGRHNVWVAYCGGITVIEGNQGRQ